MDAIPISKRKVCPDHPGTVLKMMYIEPLGLTVTKLGEVLDVTRTTASKVLNGKSAISPNMALRLSRAFKTTPELWLNMQMNYDLWHESHDVTDWKAVKPCRMLKSLAG